MEIYALKGRVIDGLSDQPIESGLVLLEGEKITYVGKEIDAIIPDGAQVVEIHDGTILPGFIDCHAHFDGSGPEATDYYATPHLDLILNTVHSIGTLVDAGFTAVREMGLFGPYIKRAVQRGSIRGPRVMPGARILSVTAGHADMDINYSPAYCQQHSIVSYLVDGVDECIKGTRLQFREGAEFIKICATGGVSSMVDGINDVQFSFEEIQAIVQEAERHGTYVAAHCTGNAGTYQALRAGVKSIEHGIFLDERCIELMVKNDVSLVTTLTISQGIPKMKDKLPKHIYEKGCLCAEANLRSMEMARAASIRIVLGTDFSDSPNTPYAENGKEFAAMVKAGFTTMESIKNGTINAAYLMKMSDQIGSLEAGKLADVVVVEGNPLMDINLLAHQDHIKAVFKNGQKVK